MIKIFQITQEQLDALNKARNPVKAFKDIVNIQPKAKYGMGDTMIQVDNAKTLDLYKNTFHGKDVFYIIIEAVNEQAAFAYSLYPM